MELATSFPVALVTEEMAPCYNVTNEKEVLSMLHYIHAVFASFSILGSLSVIIYAMFKRIVNTSEVRPLFHLALADLGLALCWLIVWEIPFQGVGSRGFRFCTMLQAFTEMFNVISFFLTVNYALNVYLRLKDRLNRAQRLTLLHTMTSFKWIMRLFYVISWVLPIVVMMPVVIVYNNVRSLDPCTECLVLFFKPSVQRNESFAWENYGAIFFMISILLSFVAIVTLYVLSARVYRRLMKKNVWTNKQRQALVDLCKRISLYISVFAICWTPSLTLNAMDLFTEGKASVTENEWLYVLQGITAPSQGFLNCIIYGWTRTTFRMANATQDTRPILGQSYRIYGTSLFPKIRGASRQRPIQSAISDLSEDTSVGGAPTSPLDFQSP